MHASKPLVFTVLGAVAFGVGYDIVHFDDSHHPSRIPITALSTATSTTTTASSQALIYTANWYTGEEIRVPPQELRPRQQQSPLAHHRKLTYAVQIQIEDGSRSSAT